MPCYCDVGLSIDLTLPTSHRPDIRAIRQRRRSKRGAAGIERPDDRMGDRRPRAVRSTACRRRHCCSCPRSTPQTWAGQGAGSRTAYLIPSRAGISAPTHRARPPAGRRTSRSGSHDHLILGQLRSRGRLANADIRQLIDSSRARVQRLMGPAVPERCRRSAQSRSWLALRAASHRLIGCAAECDSAGA